MMILHMCECHMILYAGQEPVTEYTKEETQCDLCGHSMRIFRVENVMPVETEAIGGPMTQIPTPITR